MVLATDKTNSTTSSNDHPAHHNALAEAINRLDVVVYNATAYGTGATDVEIQAAIDAASAAGGGSVLIPSGDWTLADTVTLKDDVVLYLGAGVTITWAGAGGGSMFENDIAAGLYRSGIVGQNSTIDPSGTAGVVFDLHSPTRCRFQSLHILDGTATSVTMKIVADATATDNAFFNDVDDIHNEGVCGTFIYMEGPSALAGAAVCTLNHFQDLFASDVRVYGIRLVSYCDNNVFSGQVTVQLYANNAVGVIFNDSVTPGSGTGVYANQWDHLAVDTFDTYTNRVGVLFNTSSRTQIMAFHQDPVAEGGSIVDNLGRATSYRVTQIGGVSGNPIAIYEKLGYRFGNFLFGTDNTYDIGAAGATRPRDLYLAGKAVLGGDLDAVGGYRQTIDGWYAENPTGTAGPTVLTRLALTTDNPNAWIAPRAGSITAVSVHANAARATGTLTATVRKNATPIALTAVLDGTNTTFKTTTSAKDALTFVAGDLLDVTWTTSSWTPTTADIRAAIEIET